jgi:hypothetical protein
MGKEYKFGQMELNMMDNGVMVRYRGMVFSFMEMEMSLKENFKMTKQMGMLNFQKIQV